MVKAYLRYQHEAAYGLLVSHCNAIFDRSGTFFVTAALEAIAIWKAKTGKLLARLEETSYDTHRPAEVKYLCRSLAEDQVAVGYSDGAIKIWDLQMKKVKSTFHGHKRAITKLSFTSNGGLLASGSQDCSICVWDLVSDTGVVKLQGHTNEITGLNFLQDENLLVSSCRDGQLKLWELPSQQCWQTLLHELGTISSMAINPQNFQLLVASLGKDLHIYELEKESEHPALELTATLQRIEDDKVQDLVFSSNGQYIACKNFSNQVEIFESLSISLTSQKEDGSLKRKASKKILKELRKKAKKTPLTKKELKKQKKHEEQLHEEPALSESKEFYKSVYHYQGSSKMVSIDFRPFPKQSGPLSQVEVGVALSSNAFEILPLFDNDEETGRSIKVYHGGHRSGIRSLALSSDDAFLLSLSEKEIKIWKSENGNCTHTISSGYGLCGIFAPGDDTVIIGTKNGKLEIFDLHASSMIQSMDAHDGPIWSIVAQKDGSGFISGGADCHAKFWTWKLQAPSHKSESKNQISSVQDQGRELEMESDILAMKISPDGRLLAVALLDTTIRLFFLDSLSVYLSLYGHKLPVLSIDISSDSQLLVSGSADKNLKIWGLDFGDCHKSIFAHDDSITHVAFVPLTHYLFSVSKDRMLKYWDVDKFQLLLALPSHHAEIWCLIPSQDGDFIFTGSSDRSLRKWIKTDEPFFLEEEKEKRREQLFDQDLLDEDTRQSNRKDQKKTDSFGVAGEKTIASINAADSIIEALELSSLELKKDPKEASNPLLLGLEPDAFVLRAVQNIKSIDLEMALLSISFSDALLLLKYLAHWLQKSTHQTEMLCRVTLLLLRLHHQQLSSSLPSRSILLDLQATLHSHLAHLQERVGFNLAGIKCIRRLRPGNDVAFLSSL